MRNKRNRREDFDIYSDDDFDILEDERMDDFENDDYRDAEEYEDEPDMTAITEMIMKTTMATNL